MAPRPAARGRDQDGNQIARADLTREEARAECARVIADAAAQGE